MSDLISRSAVIDVLKETGIIQDNDLGHLVVGEIERIPTAYDVDKVVKELKAKIKNIYGLYNRETPILESLSRKDAFNNGICEAIEIVKGGGVNEIKN